MTKIKFTKKNKYLCFKLHMTVYKKNIMFAYLKTKI